MNFSKLCYPVKFGVTVKFHAYSKLIENLEKLCGHRHFAIKVSVCNLIKRKTILPDPDESFRLFTLPSPECQGGLVEYSETLTSSFVIEHAIGLRLAGCWLGRPSQ